MPFNKTVEILINNELVDNPRHFAIDCSGLIAVRVFLTSDQSVEYTMRVFSSEDGATAGAPKGFGPFYAEIMDLRNDYSNDVVEYDVTNIKYLHLMLFESSPAGTMTMSVTKIGVGD